MSLRKGDKIIGTVPTTEELVKKVIDDSVTSTETTWSSAKADAMIKAKINDNALSTTTAYSSQKLTDLITNGWVTKPYTDAVTMLTGFTRTNSSFMINDFMKMARLYLTFTTTNAINAGTEFRPFNIISPYKPNMNNALLVGNRSGRFYVGCIDSGGQAWVTSQTNTGAGGEIWITSEWFYN